MSRAVTSIIIVAVAFAVVWVTGIYFFDAPEQKTIEFPQSIDYQLEGFSRVSVRTEENTLVLEGSCYSLSLFVSASQQESVEAALSGQIGKRPLTHDITSDSLVFFGVDVLLAKIDGLEEGTYKASILMREDNDVLEIDSRPSDAIALAYRSRAPVYVKDSMLIAEGKKVC